MGAKALCGLGWNGCAQRFGRGARESEKGTADSVAVPIVRQAKRRGIAHIGMAYAIHRITAKPAGRAGRQPRQPLFR
jgi:hypothetical protein